MKNDIKLFNQTNKSTNNILKTNPNSTDIDNCSGDDGTPRRKSDSDALDRATAVVGQAKQKLLRYSHVESIDNNNQQTVSAAADDSAPLLTTSSKNIKNNLDQNKNVVEQMQQEDPLRTASSDSTPSIGGSVTRHTSPPWRRSHVLFSLV